MNIIAIDTETTGLDPIVDEIIQFSAVDFDGNKLADFLIKPLFHEDWPEAEKVNHIPPEAVKDCPTVFDIMGEIQSVLKGADLIVGYNVNFDLNFLRHSNIKIPDVETLDVKKIFERMKNEVAADGISLKWQSLIKCAEYYGYDWNGAPHDGLADARATMFCFRKIFGI